MPRNARAQAPLEFKDGDRTFLCRAETSPATPDTSWWWVSISGESQRYAAFHAEAGDTPEQVRRRVLRFYADLLAARERPRVIHGPWSRGRPPKQPDVT